jgi:DNA polymerase III subunit beta
MQITVNRNDLGSAVNWAFQGVAKRYACKALEGMRITVADGRLTMAAFDYDVTATAHVFGDDAESGTIMVTGLQLRDAIRALPKGKNVRAVISADDAALTITCDGITSHVPAVGWDLAEYPALPDMPAHAGTIAGVAFARMVTRVSAAAGTDDTLPSLKCVAVEMSDKLSMAATDRYRLACDVADWTSSGLDAPKGDVLVPAKILAAFAKASGGAGKITVHAGGNDIPSGKSVYFDGMAGFATDERELIVHTVSGQFPRWRGLLPDSAETTVTADAAALVAAVKRAGAVAERATPVRFEANGAIHLQVWNDGTLASDQEIPAERTGPEITTAFNPAYLASLVVGVTGTVRFGFTAAGKPAQISAADDSDAFRAILMPIRMGA